MYMNWPAPFSMTSKWVRGHWQEAGIEPEVVDLVCAMLDTGVLGTTYSCRGHFNLREKDGFCHHNQKAQIHFQVKDVAKAAALCNEILLKVLVDEIDIEVRQIANRDFPDEPVEVEWMLEFRPIGFWDMRPQDSGMLITVREGWTEEKARKLIAEAFAATIEICKNGEWKSGCQT